jgi:tetratricopeptide (TPR) repeat protein
MFSQAILIFLLFQGANPLAVLEYRANQHFESGEYSQARAELQQALKVAPNDPALWSSLGTIDSKLNNSEAAIADFETACALNHQSASDYFNLGLLYHQRGETAKALEDFRRGLALAPDDPAANQGYARLLMDAHRYREAIAPLERLKRNSPSELSPRVALIESYFQAGLNEQGGKEIQEFVKVPNCSIHDQLGLAELLDEEKLPDAARLVLEQVVRAADDIADAHGGLGMVLTEMGRYEDAANELGRAVQLSPDSAEYGMRLAEALLLSNQYSAALYYLNSVKGRFGELPEYRYKLGLAYYADALYPSAIDEFEKLVRDYPSLDRAEYFLGHSYSKAGDPGKAEIHYRKALALNPQDASYEAALGNALKSDNGERLDEAIVHLEKAVQLDPSDNASKQDLAVCYEKKRRYPDAERLLEEVVRREPELIAAHRVLAGVYYRQGKKEQGDRESALVAKLDDARELKEEMRNERLHRLQLQLHDPSVPARQQ